MWKISWSLVWCLLLATGTHTQAQDTDGLDCSLNERELENVNDGTLLLRTVINQAQATVTVELEYEGEGWLGFSFSESGDLMVPNTAIIGSPDDGVVQKYSLTLRDASGVTALQDRQTLTDASITQQDGKTTLRFTKPLVEDSEAEVAAGNIQILWAIGLSNEFPSIHKRRNDVIVDIQECLEAGQTAAPVSVAPTEAPVTAAPTPAAVELGEGILQRSVPLDDIDITLTTDENQGTITVDMVYEGVGYIAFGFSEDNLMPGSVAVIAFPDAETGTPTKWDMSARSASGVVEAPSARQTLKDAVYTQNATHTTMSFTKPLVEEGEPAVSLTESNFFLWAIGSDNSFARHEKRGDFPLNLASDEVFVPPTVKNYKPMWITHGIFMAVAWAVLVPLAVGASLIRNLLPVADGVWFQIHQILNGLGVLLTVIGFAIAVYIIADSRGDSAVHFKELRHHTIGLVVFIFAFLQAVSGIFRPHAVKKAEPTDEEDGAEPEEPKKPLKRTIFECQHRILGTVAMILGWYNCSSGIEAFRDIYGGTDLAGLLWGVIAAITFGTLIGAVYDRTRS